MQVADVLSRVMKQLQVAATEAEGRQDVLAAIQALDAAVAEAEWLSGYEDDPNKYKVGAWRWSVASPLTCNHLDDCLTAPGLPLLGSACSQGHHQPPILRRCLSCAMEWCPANDPSALSRGGTPHARSKGPSRPRNSGSSCRCSSPRWRRRWRASGLTMAEPSCTMAWSTR